MKIYQKRTVNQLVFAPVPPMHGILVISLIQLDTKLLQNAQLFLVAKVNGPFTLAKWRLRTKS